LFVFFVLIHYPPTDLSTLSLHDALPIFFDKKLNNELLSSPIRLAISTDNPEHWPAWNMDFADEQRAPRSYVSGSPKITVIENGRSEEHTSELQSPYDLVCRLLLEKKKKK